MKFTAITGMSFSLTFFLSLFFFLFSFFSSEHLAGKKYLDRV